MIEVDEASIVKASNQFWEQMLAMKLDPMASPDEFCLASGHVVGTVSLSGAWNGRIEIRMDEALGHEATAAMLMQSIEFIADSDVIDATKEITNMIAGVVKSALPRPCVMTVPDAAVKQERYCAVMRDHDCVAVAFHHEKGDLMVSVLMEAAPAS